MKNSLLVATIARTIFCITSLLFLDTFVFKSQSVTESILDLHETAVGAGGATGRSRFYLHSESGHLYKVPESVYNMVSVSDTFFISKSYLFKRPLKIRYTFENNPYQQNLNILNNGFFGLGITLFIFFVSLINITRRPLLQKENFNKGALFFSCILLLGILSFYFSW